MAKPEKKSPQEFPPSWVSLVRFVHPFPSLLVAAVTVAVAFLADSSPEAASVVALGAGMLCYQFAIGAANDVVDAADDAKWKPWKALPRGLISKRVGTWVVAGLAGAGVAITAALPLGAWLIGMGGLACGLAYDVSLKRTPLSWLPLSIALPLIPLWVFTALGEWDALLWWTLPLGAVLGLALHLANQAPDVPKETTVRGLAHRLGTARAANLSLGLVGVAGVVAVAVLLFEREGTRALLVAASVLLAHTMAGRAVRLFGPDGLFGLLGATSAAMAVTFISAAA